MIDKAGQKLIAERNGIRSGLPDGRYHILPNGAARLIQSVRGGQMLGASRGDFFFSPDEVQNEQEQVNRLVDSLGVDVNANAGKLPARITNGFVQFWNEWKAFYKDRSGFLARHERSTYEKTLEYRAQATSWQAQLKKAGAQLTALSLQKGGQSGDGETDRTTKILKWIGIGTAVVFGLGLAAKLVHTVMLGAAELGEAETTAMAIADAARNKRNARKLITIT